MNVEITVPRIILPLPSLDEGEGRDEMEQIHLSFIDAHGSPAERSHQQSDQAATSATYVMRQTPFRLFAFKHIHVSGQTLLLQVLRRLKQRNQRQQRDTLITEELTFTIEVHQAKEASQVTQTIPFPGRQRVAIILDEEGLPTRYSIDGVER